jgi:hypothetical protein
MKDKKYHAVSTILKSNIKIVALWAQNYPLGENNVLLLILMELLIITVAIQESEIISFQFWVKITCQWV